MGMMTSDPVLFRGSGAERKRRDRSNIRSIVGLSARDAQVIGASPRLQIGFFHRRS